MTDWKDRLRRQLEPVLEQADPRPAISAYHDMPYAIFRYPPEDEFAVRQEIALLRTRLEQSGKRVTSISLAACMYEALEAEGLGTEALAEAEKTVGLESTIETIHQVGIVAPRARRKRSPSVATGVRSSHRACR